MCSVFVCFSSLDLNVKNSVIRFFCLSVQFPESTIPTGPDNRGSTGTVVAWEHQKPENIVHYNATKSEVDTLYH